ncbi:hypothetical protein, partial [Bacillus toyonensis]|uniref:hypothetical protein n=1 Tax=Bacillus toyonensis TaxID=155322 RepID=UPI000BFB115B
VGLLVGAAEVGRITAIGFKLNGDGKKFATKKDSLFLSFLFVGNKTKLHHNLNREYNKSPFHQTLLIELLPTKL